MGNTCASIHVFWPGPAESVVAAVTRAYQKLGYERLKKLPPKPENAKSVVVAAKRGQHFVSIYDSRNALLDDGELKDVALAASKSLHGPAVFTSLYDSDTFEFILFAGGKQVDLLMSDAASYQGPLKQLNAKSRATQWAKLFARPFDAQQIAQAAQPGGAFADGNVAALAKLIGLPAGQALRNYQDLAEEREEILAQLFFEKKPAADAETAATAARTGTIEFSYYRGDEYRARRVLAYPAAWPMPIGKERVQAWSMLTLGAGFQGGTGTVRVDGPTGLRVTEAWIAGFRFHNTQIVGLLETRPKDLPADSEHDRCTLTQLESPAPETRLYRFDYPHLNVPTVTPARTTQILLVVQLHFEAYVAGDWEIALTLAPGAQTAYAYALPPLRVAAIEDTWRPVVSGLNPATTYEAEELPVSLAGYLARFDAREIATRKYEFDYKQKKLLDGGEDPLLHPTIASSVVILNDAGQTTLDACRTLFETWLRPLTAHIDGEIRLSTEKHVSNIGSKATKATGLLPPASFLTEKKWSRAFDYANAYQTIQAVFVSARYGHAIAGIGVQYPLNRAARAQSGEQQAIADALTVMRGRPVNEQPYNGALHASLWVIAHPECYQALQTSPGDLVERTTAFVASQPTLQAWSVEAAWIPHFDTYGRFEETPYEDRSVMSWFRGVVPAEGLYGRLMPALWCDNVLRMIAPHLWLSPNLMEQLDRAEVDRVAHVTQAGAAFKLELRPERSIGDLELALLPILPVESVRIHAVPTPDYR